MFICKTTESNLDQNDLPTENKMLTFLYSLFSSASFLLQPSFGQTVPKQAYLLFCFQFC